LHLPTPSIVHLLQGIFAPSSISAPHGLGYNYS
jgi:hypothetical protein